jgi:hypothetical protein
MIHTRCELAVEYSRMLQVMPRSEYFAQRPSGSWAVDSIVKVGPYTMADPRS